MERQAKDGTFYKQVGQDEWSPVTRQAKDGTTYKKIGQDAWSPMEQESQELELPKQDESNAPQAGLEGFGQGATFGYLAQLQAKAEPITDRLFNVVTGSDVEPAPWSQLHSNEKEYVEARDQNIKRQEDFKETNPKSYYGGQIGGSIVSAAAMAPLATGGKLVQATKLGGAYGAISNPGDLEGIVDELQLDDRSKNAVIGAVTGLGMQAGLDKIAKMAPAIARKIRNVAERRAAAAMGAERGTIKKLGADKVKEIGRYGLDEGIVTPLASTDDMIARNAAAKQAGGSKMDDVYTAIDDAGASEFNPLDVAGKVDDELGGLWRSPINKGEVNQLENTLESILIRGEKNIPLREAQKLKQELGKVANWKNNINITDKEKMARDAYGVVNKAIDEATESGAKSLGKSGLVEKLGVGKKLFSNASGAGELLTNKAAREQGNKLVGLTDWALLGAGGGSAAATGGASIPATLALYGGKKLVEKFGNQTTAKILDKAAKMLLKTPKYQSLLDKNPAVFQALVHKIAVKGERTILKKAADKNDPLKGEDKWAFKGFEKLQKQDKKGLLDNAKTIENLFSTKKGMKLLVTASSMKGEKALSKLLDKVNKGVK